MCRIESGVRWNGMEWSRDCEVHSGEWRLRRRVGLRLECGERSGAWRAGERRGKKSGTWLGVVCRMGSGVWRAACGEGRGKWSGKRGQQWSGEWSREWSVDSGECSELWRVGCAERRLETGVRKVECGDHRLECLRRASCVSCRAWCVSSTRIVRG